MKNLQILTNTGISPPEKMEMIQNRDVTLKGTKILSVAYN